MLSFHDNNTYFKLNNIEYRLKVEPPKEGDSVLVLPTDKGGLAIIKPSELNVGDSVIVIPLKNGEKRAIGIFTETDDNKEIKVEKNSNGYIGIYKTGSDTNNSKQILEKIEKFWTQSKACPICGYNTWNLTNRSYNLVQSDESKSNNSKFPCFPVTCGKCGYTILFNSISLGFLPNVDISSEE